jgi:4-amino-4-deoxy-L-arabinose transferase-like glycosyltransferase
MKASGPYGSTAGAVALGILAFHLLLAGQTTLWDRDEPRFARAAVQMARSGQYLYPVFGEEVRAQKPILIDWLMTLPIAALGVGELSEGTIATTDAVLRQRATP